MTCNAFAVLVVTDGTTRIDLLNCGRWMLTYWDPTISGAKGGGTWQDSPLSPGRQLVDYQRANWIDVFTMMLNQSAQDDVIYQEQELLRLMEKAVSYWTSQWQNEPVWIEARAARETNTRYAVIKSYLTPRGSGNPFGQPFILPEPRSIIEDFQLTLEHGPWLADEPGTGTCVEVSGKQSAYPFHLTFNQKTSEVNCGSDAALDNLPLADFTAEAWVRLDTCGAANSSYLFNKLDWWLAFDCINNYVQVFGDYTIINMSTIVTTFPFLDGEWHHIAVQSIGPGPLFFVFIDGADAVILSNAAGAGVYDDSAFDFYIGNSVVGTNAFDGDIGWCRISDINRYTVGVPFTPPLRCILPAIDGNTVAQWIGAERSGAPIDNQEGTAALDGTQTDCTFNADCEYGRDATCEDEVYIANKHNRAQLTHIFILDGVAWSGNLIGAATPFNLLPAVPVANDAVYFGIDTTIADSGPFCSLVFDIGTVITGVTGLVWEYWNGAAWAALTVQDNTANDGGLGGVAFDTSGVNSVHWEQPSAWATVAVNGVTGYWVRVRVTIAAGATAPTQQNRDVYSILWPYIEVALDQIGGDIGALARHIIKQQSGSSPLTTALVDNRITIGLRSISRGDNFTAYLNFADEQNPSGITAVAGANSAFANDVQSPAGRALVYTPVGAEALGNRGAVQFDSTITSEFFGTFHAFLRVVQTGGSAGDFGVRLQIDTNGIPTVTTNTAYTQLAAGSFEIFDFGQISLPGYELPSGYIPNFISIQVWASAVAAGGRTLAFYDLVIIPVDEWGADYVDPTAAPGGRIIGGSNKMYLDADNISYPKDALGLSFVRNSDDDTIEASYRHIGSRGPLVQSNTEQRIWYLSHYATATDTLLSSRIETCHSMQFFKSQMYLYARGNR